MQIFGHVEVGLVQRQRLDDRGMLGEDLADLLRDRLVDLEAWLHSRIAPACCSTAIAHPRTVRIAVRLSLVISIKIAPGEGRILAALGSFRAANTEQGFQNVGGRCFSTCSAILCKISYAAILSSLSTSRMTTFIASSEGRCSAFASSQGARRDEIYALCRLNRLPFNATGEVIKDGGVWKVYELIGRWTRFCSGSLQGSLAA